MKHLTLVFLLVITAMSASAQTYIGTMTFGSYTQKNVVAHLTVNGDKAVLLMEKVKFSRFMPVKIDVTFDGLEVSTPTDANGNQIEDEPLSLKAEGIVPLSKGKRFEKYTVSQGRGQAGKTCDFSCLMGEKKVTYTGTLK